MTPLPQVMVGPKGAKELRKSHPWCYRTEVLSGPVDAPVGSIAQIVDQQKNPIGTGFWARTSPIAIRLLTRGNEKIDDAFFLARLEAAVAKRSSIAHRDAYRVIHGESDGLPGLFADRYGPAITIQTLAEGMDARKALIAAALQKLTGVKLVVCRDDGSGRDFEGLPREKRVLLGEGDTRVRYHEGSNAFEIDLLSDAKTGSFLDQVDNHLRAGELGRGDALDTFSYHGGFALSLARNCRSVIAVEQDPIAADKARANAAANGLTNVTVETANAFDVLRREQEAGRKFDTVIIDPPGLAKRKEGVRTALRAYHELNMRAFKLAKPGALVVTCSCSGKVSRDDFEEMVLSASQDARRSVQVLERRGPGIDHAGLLGVSETEYLKAWFLRVT